MKVRRICILLFCFSSIFASSNRYEEALKYSNLAIKHVSLYEMKKASIISEKDIFRIKISKKLQLVDQGKYYSCFSA